MTRALYIINPAGHGGAGLKAWDRFQALWPDTIPSDCAVMTSYPGHAREIAAAPDGCDTLIAVGGDGTVAEIMSAIMDRRGQKPKLAFRQTLVHEATAGNPCPVCETGTALCDRLHPSRMRQCGLSRETDLVG